MRKTERILLVLTASLWLCTVGMALKDMRREAEYAALLSRAQALTAFHAARVVHPPLQK